MAGMMLLPPKSDVCQECAVEHDPELPHNKDSLYYQTKFHMEHGRYPTWEDATAHCSDRMKKIWKKKLKEHGVDI